MTSTITNARKWATLAICCVGALVLAIDLTALHLAIPGLIRDLDPSSTQILWIADMYGFALAGLLITMGILGDRFGRKRLLLIGTVAFAAASAITAYAPSAELLIAARALLGVAGATIMPSTLSLVRNVFTDPKERTTAVGIWTGVTSAGIGIGPVAGGLLLDRFWWGSVFLINVPIMALVFLAAVWVVPESRNPRPGRIDIVSVPLSITGMLGVVYAIKESARDGFSAHVGWTALAGAAALTIFVRRQTRLAEPLIDVRLFRSRAFSGSVNANMIAMFAVVAQSLLFSQYFQLVLGWSPLRAGLAGLPGALAAMASGGMAGPLVNVLGRARVVALGMGVAAIGFALYTVAGTSSNYPALIPAVACVGLGMGFTFAVTSDTMLAAVPKERSGAASAISETATELGGALGMAVLGTLLNHTYRTEITVPAGLPPEAAHSVRDSLGAALRTAAGLPADLAGTVTGAARQAFVSGMHLAAVASAVLALVAAVTVIFALRGVPAVIPDLQEDHDGQAQPVPVPYA